MKIGLDIDGVLCNFIEGFYKHFNEPFVVPTQWDVDFVYDNWSKVVDDEAFWMSLEPLIEPKEINFDIYCYVTARPIPTCITYLWLIKNGFPKAPVFSTGLYSDKHCKIATIKRLELDYFVDDKWQNFLDINNNTKTTCFLQSHTHNIQEEDGGFRINSLTKLNEAIEDVESFGRIL